MLANVFVILTAYYLIKPVREGWIAISAIGNLSGMEVRAFSSFGQVLLLLLVVPLYAHLSGRMHRLRLITGVNLFFICNLLIFWLLQPGLPVPFAPYIGVAFYLWVGIFSVSIVAQFWIFAADFYNDASGKRLFPLIAVGATGGGVVGAWMAGRLVSSGLVDTFTLLLLAIVLLLASTFLTVIADRRGPDGSEQSRSEEAQRVEAPEGGGTQGAYRLIFRHRYLMATAILVLLFSWVNRNGANILFGAVQESIAQEIHEAGVMDTAVVEQMVQAGTTAFYGDLYFWANLLGFLLQALFASRLLKYGGFGALLLMMPVVSVISYSAMALIPALGVIKFFKVAESSTNYSINNTARHVLWLPTTREMKYKAKAAVDTLFARSGDGLAALTVLVGIRVLSLQISWFLILNVALALLWLVVGIVVVREHRRMVRVHSEAGERTPLDRPATD